MRRNSDCSFDVIVRSQHDPACSGPDWCPAGCEVQEYNECTGCLTSRRVRQNSDCSFSVVIDSQTDSACSGDDWCPEQCEVREFNECTACSASRRIRQNLDCSYSVIIPSQNDPACNYLCQQQKDQVAVSGRAFCENDGSAVSGATIKLVNDRGNVVKTATTNGNGQWGISDSFNSAIGGDHEYSFRADASGSKTPKNSYEHLQVNRDVIKMAVWPLTKFSHNQINFAYDCPAAPPQQVNSKPEGWLDSADCNSFVGWVRDPDTVAPVDVHFYADGPAGTGTFIGSANANVFRQDLCNLWGNGNADCSHGFVFSLPASLRDGKQHSIYAHGIDSSGGENPLLSGVPKPVTCEAPQTTANRKPEGFLDSVDCGVFVGWARDPDTVAPVDVHFYADGPAGTGRFIGSARADVFRQDLCNRFGNGDADCSHGFSFVTPDVLKDGKDHDIFVYGIDGSVIAVFSWGAPVSGGVSSYSLRVNDVRDVWAPEGCDARDAPCVGFGGSGDFVPGAVSSTSFRGGAFSCSVSGVKSDVGVAVPGGSDAPSGMGVSCFAHNSSVVFAVFSWGAPVSGGVSSYNLRVNDVRDVWAPEGCDARDVPCVGFGGSGDFVPGAVSSNVYRAVVVPGHVYDWSVQVVLFRVRFRV
ncbi:carboxypeptidase regulatory-like domain-containing protein [Candidatus Woesearchaeota archaeon]|nr:carboxypeptidase regulatory-like domain-containing protein [Candidatus Woesearchaeota archaeon]